MRSMQAFNDSTVDGDSSSGIIRVLMSEKIVLIDPFQ